MSGLHAAVYQMVLDPQILTDLGQNSQKVMDEFNLSHSEVVTLKSVFTDQNSLQKLLSPETLKRAAQDLGLNAWIQPSP